MLTNDEEDGRHLSCTVDELEDGEALGTEGLLVVGGVGRARGTARGETGGAAVESARGETGGAALETVLGRAGAGGAVGALRQRAPRARL